MDEELLRKNIQKYARILAEADGDAKKVKRLLINYYQRQRIGLDSRQFTDRKCKEKV